MKAKITDALVKKLKKDIQVNLPTKEYEVRDTELKGFLLRVLPSGKLVYTMVYARHKRVTIGNTDQLDPAQARAAAKKIAGDHANAEVGIGEDPIEKRERIAADNYIQFLDEHYKPHLEATLRKGVNNERNVKETLANLKNGFPDFHRLGLNEITPHIIDRWRQRRRQDGVSQARIKRQMNDLSACLNKAISWGALSENPLDKVDKVKSDSSAKVRYLSQAEEAKLRSFLDARESKMKAARLKANEWRTERGYDLYPAIPDDEFVDHLKPAVLLSLNTGLRRGELFGLSWNEVSFEQKTLTVIADTAKDGETRHIPLNAEALSVLKQWNKQRKAEPSSPVVAIKEWKCRTKCEWVFQGEGDQPIQNMRKAWVKLLKDAKIADFRWHDLRHTFASKLVMAGVDLNAVRELLGHSDYEMTLRYAHLAPSHKREAVDKLAPVHLAT